MLFVRLIWSALVAALIVGSVQFGIEQWRAVPILRAAEVFESHKVESAEPEHAHGDPGLAVDDEVPFRAAWTWIANVLHGFSMALLMFAVMGWWVWRRGGAVAPSRLALTVAAAGLLSLDVWPTLGLPADLPGMDAADLGARQVWWLLAAASAALACALLAGIATRRLPSRWRWLAALLLLALPFIIGAPQLLAEPLAGFDAQARAQLQTLHREFIWTTRGLSLSFWIGLGCVGGWVFDRWIKSAIPCASEVPELRGIVE
ncbi:MAG: CbtA family protein [Ramlibacter sp.]